MGCKTALCSFAPVIDLRVSPASPACPFGVRRRNLRPVTFQRCPANRSFLPERFNAKSPNLVMALQAICPFGGPITGRLTLSRLANWHLLCDFYCTPTNVLGQQRDKSRLLLAVLTAAGNCGDSVVTQDKVASAGVRPSCKHPLQHRVRPLWPYWQRLH